MIALIGFCASEPDSSVQSNQPLPLPVVRSVARRPEPANEHDVTSGDDDELKTLAEFYGASRNSSHDVLSYIGANDQIHHHSRPSLNASPVNRVTKTYANELSASVDVEQLTDNDSNISVGHSSSRTNPNDFRRLKRDVITGNIRWFLRSISRRIRRQAENDQDATPDTVWSRDEASRTLDLLESALKSAVEKCTKSQEAYLSSLDYQLPVTVLSRFSAEVASAVHAASVLTLLHRTSAG
jgi:hypothetical protein